MTSDAIPFFMPSSLGPDTGVFFQAPSQSFSLSKSCALQIDDGLWQDDSIVNMIPLPKKMPAIAAVDILMMPLRVWIA